MNILLLAKAGTPWSWEGGKRERPRFLGPFIQVYSIHKADTEAAGMETLSHSCVDFLLLFYNTRAKRSG